MTGLGATLNGDDLTDAKHWNTYWSNYEKNKNTSNRRF